MKMDWWRIFRISLGLTIAYFLVILIGFFAFDWRVLFSEVFWATFGAIMFNWSLKK